jgi:hypothetical protein
MQKFSFQDMENCRIKIAADRTVADPEDPDHEDKLPKNTRAVLPRVRPLYPGIPLKPGVRMILMKIARCLSAQHLLLMLFLPHLLLMLCRPQLSRTRKSLTLPL